MAQLMTVVCGPLATADDDIVSLSQTAAAGQYLVINGVGAAGTFTANSICASQTPSGASDLTINGTLATTNPIAGAGGTAAAGGATVRFPTPQRIYVTTAGNSSARTMTITGTVQTPGSFGPGVVLTETFNAPNTNTRASTYLYSTIISISISGAATGAITVGHSGTSTLDLGRHIIITSAGNDTGITFTISGTDWNNDPITEVVTGASGTAASSVLNFKTVTSVLTSGATAGAVTVGTNAIAESPPVYFDRLASTAPIAIQVDGSGTVSWTVQQTLNDPTIISNQLPTPTYIWSPSSINWVNHPDSALVASAVTTGVQGNYAYAPVMARIKLNSGSGTVRATFVQAYLG